MRKFICVFMLAILVGAVASAQSTDLFSESRWQGRVSYKDSDGINRNELYELILVPNGTCIVTVSGRQDSQDLFQDADGLWSFDETFFRLECDFSEPVFEHLPAVKWASVYQFDALKSRFTLLVKPYPDAPNLVRVAFNRVDD